MKLSIITVNYNDAKGLQKTFDSVFSQTFKEFEYIVIDGGSSDSSKEIIEGNKDKISYWVSEKDSGIYNGMNKGIKAAKGDYLLFLNSGDCLANHDVLQNVIPNLIDKSFYYGKLFYSKNGVRNLTWIPPQVLTFPYFLKNSLPHPATFIKRNLFETFGYYNESLRIVSDWEFFIKTICKHNESYQFIDVFVSDFDNDGISSNTDNQKKIEFEKATVLQTHFPFFANDVERLGDLDSKRLKEFIFLKNNKGFKWTILKIVMNLLFIGNKSIKKSNYYLKIK